MKLIVGLGNPGSEYDKTRHNAGFVALDRVAQKWGEPGGLPKARFQGLTRECVIGSGGGGEKCVLLKPTTYMNLSGRSVAEAVGFYKLDFTKDLLVLVDETALPAGTIRVRSSGSAGGHNGLKDIERALSSQGYPRLRIGVDPCPPMMKLEDYVLGRFTAEQAALVDAALKRAVEAVGVFVNEGVEAAMNRFNAPDPAEKPEKPKQIDPGWLGAKAAGSRQSAVGRTEGTEQ